MQKPFLNNCFFAIPLFCILCLSSCAVQSPEAEQQARYLWENPEPRPEYIWGMYFGNGSQCLDVFSGFFTDTSYVTSGYNLKNLIDKVKIVIDGYPIENLRLGDSRFVFHVCFSIDRLGEGFHSATMTLEKFSGTEASYTWAFHVKERIWSKSAEELANLVEFPSLVLTPSATKTPIYKP